MSRYICNLKVCKILVKSCDYIRGPWTHEAHWHPNFSALWTPLWDKNIPDGVCIDHLFFFCLRGFRSALVTSFDRCLTFFPNILFSEILLEVFIMPLWFLLESGHSCGIQWNPVESSGIFFGRAPCQNYHSGDHLFWQNRAIPELGLEWSQNGQEQNLAECILHV